MNPPGRVKVFILGKVALARTMNLPLKKGDPARRFTLPFGQTFSFSPKRFDKFCKEIKEKLARPPTYPSPMSTFCPKWEVSVNVGLGEGYVGSFAETYTSDHYTFAHLPYP